MQRWTLFGLIGWLAFTLASPLVAQPFTYQGFLKQNGQPVNGAISLTFRLYDALTGGNQIGGTITQNVNVQNGLFTVELNFGAVWNEAERYLEIEVAGNTLNPRVKITPTPYATFAQRPWQTSGSNLFYNDGNVGIGTSSPQGQFHVRSPITQLDQETSTTATDTLLGWTWQSFTPSVSGVLTRIAVYLEFRAAGGLTIRVFAGEGVGGALLAERTITPGAYTGWHEVAIGGVSLTAGQRYTVDVRPSGYSIVANRNNPYANGRSGAHPDFDLLLRTYMQTGIGDGLVVSDMRVGIGTDTPFARLSLGGGDANTKLAIWQGSAAADVMGLGVGPDQFRLHLHNPNNRFSFLNAPAGAELVTIRGNGFVGIGTANPVQKLHVEGQCYFRGFVGIAAPFPNYPLEVQAGAGTAVAGFANMSGAGSGYGVYGFSMTTSGSGAYFVSRGLTGAIVARTDGSYRSDWPTGWGGGLATWDICASGILATEFRNRSDERLKRDILPLDAPTELQRLLSLRPVSYYWKDERLSQERQFGFIAQELREVFPELVQESIDEQKTLSVNYQALIPLLVNALQVQQQTIEQQQVELRQLREELQQLRALLTQKR